MERKTRPRAVEHGQVATYVVASTWPAKAPVGSRFLFPGAKIRLRIFRPSGGPTEDSHGMPFACVANWHWQLMDGGKKLVVCKMQEHNANSFGVKALGAGLTEDAVLRDVEKKIGAAALHVPRISTQDA
ncbi:hypothetical protein V7S43_017838 [Phytophthora oleae]|uniref:Uncharacterized protein n=1 Tax=Phytophthora oleae TaxID=2107226 RepID=A0ABD3ES81_9STRA